MMMWSEVSSNVGSWRLFMCVCLDVRVFPSVPWPVLLSVVSGTPFKVGTTCWVRVLSPDKQFVSPSFRVSTVGNRMLVPGLPIRLDRSHRCRFEVLSDLRWGIGLKSPVRLDVSRRLSSSSLRGTEGPEVGPRTPLSPGRRGRKGGVFQWVIVVGRVSSFVE